MTAVELIGQSRRVGPLKKAVTMRLFDISDTHIITVEYKATWTPLKRETLLRFVVKTSMIEIENVQS